MSVVQVIVSGVVANIIAVDPSAIVSPSAGSITWPGGAITAQPGQTFMMQEGAGIGWTLSGSTLSPPAPVVVQVNLSTYAAAVRYGKETGGFVYQGHPIATDESSQGKIGNAALGATVVGASFSTDWKCSDGSFVTLNQAGMMGMATAILGYINACYATEAAIDAAITASTITTAAQIDAAAWPAASA